MTDRRPILALLPLALLAACTEEPTDDSRAASGEVLEGTVSDAMLPIDRVQSEPPLEDPEAFAKAQTEADEQTGGAATGETEGEAPEAEPAETSETAAVPPPEPVD